jgi:hypothetical protein
VHVTVGADASQSQVALLAGVEKPFGDVDHIICASRRHMIVEHCCDGS